METPPQAPAAPPWTDRFGQGAAQAFEHVVLTELRARGMPGTVQPDGSVRMSGPLRRTFDIEPLVLRCSAATPGEWVDLAHDFFGKALAEDLEPKTPEGTSMHLEAVRSRLKLCLYGEADVQAVRGVGRVFIPGVVAVVVVDHPHSMQTVSRETVERWGLSDDELFALAGVNVQQQDQPRRVEIPLSPSGSVIAYDGPSNFTATFGLWLEPLTSAGPDGVVFSVPTRHRILAHPIMDASVLQAVHNIVPATRRLFRQGPESVSPDLYWCQGGHFAPLPTRMDDDRVRFEPPAEFAAMLSRLQGQ